MVIRMGLQLVGIGVGLGLIASLALERVIATQLLGRVGVRSMDAGVRAGGAELITGLVAWLASGAACGAGGSVCGGAEVRVKIDRAGPKARQRGTKRGTMYRAPTRE